MSNDYLFHPDGTDSRRCPKCHAWAEAEFEYNGIGMQRIAPYVCNACDWSEPDTYEEFLAEQQPAA